MTIFATHMMHHVESCPIYNDETKKKLRELSSNREEMALKFEITVLNAFFSHLKHLILYIVESPSHKAV